MPTVLSIETSTKVCSVAVVRDNGCLFVKESNDEDYRHAEILHLFIQEALQTIPLSDIDAIAVSRGPGSYTGLRIGVSAAKGLCFATGKPLLSYCPLEAIGKKLKASHPKAEVIVSYMDARRMEVYQKILAKNSWSEVTAEIPEPNHFAAFEKVPVVIGGDGAAKFENHFETSNITLDSTAYPSAFEGGQLALLALADGKKEDVAYFEPFYLKDFKTTTPKNK